MDHSKVAKAMQHYNKIVATAISLIIVGTIFYHHVEKFEWVDSFYFTVITLATVGYGDFVPHTTAGKLFTVLYVIFGITIFVALAQTLLAKIVSRRAEKKQNK